MLKTFAFCLLALAPASATTITLDGPGLTNFVQVTNQFPGVTFSAGGGDVVLITAQNPPYEGSAPNLICTGSAPAGGARVIDCTHELILTFDTPVNDLAFTAYGNQTALGDTFALLNLTFATGGTIFDIPLDVSHTGHCPVALDCEGDPFDFQLTGITKAVFHANVDPAGTAYDDFSFTPQQTNAAPEPGAGILVLIGAGLLVVSKRPWSKG